MIRGFCLCLLLMCLPAVAAAVDLLEDYQPLPVQVGLFLGYSPGGHQYYGLLDDPAPGDEELLRAAFGESGATGVSALDESGNRFARGSIETSAASTVPGEVGKRFIAILEHPFCDESYGGVEYTPVGDYASLVDQPALVIGSDISVDMRLPSDPGFNVWVRFLFTDTDDDEEYVTLGQAVSVGTWGTVSQADIQPGALTKLPGAPGDDVFSGTTTFPVSIEVLIPETEWSGTSFSIDFDNFAVTSVTPVPEPASLLLLGLAGLAALIRRRNA